MYMDGIGMRPALWEVADRIAGQGYFVVLPDLFYRVGYKAEYGVTVFSDPEKRKDLMTRIMPSASAANVMRDTDALFEFIDQQPNVRAQTIGVTGYCMGGRLAMYAAGHYGDRIAAAAAYHPGGLATDAPDSPHRLAPTMRARVYVGAAMEDQSFDDAQKARFDAALSDAGVSHTIETYQARHGFVPPDTPDRKSRRTIRRRRGGTTRRSLLFSRIRYTASTHRPALRAIRGRPTHARARAKRPTLR